MFHLSHDGLGGDVMQDVELLSQMCKAYYNWFKSNEFGDSDFELVSQLSSEVLFRMSHGRPSTEEERKERE